MLLYVELHFCYSTCCTVPSLWVFSRLRGHFLRSKRDFPLKQTSRKLKRSELFILGTSSSSSAAVELWCLTVMRMQRPWCCQPLCPFNSYGSYSTKTTGFRGLDVCWGKNYNRFRTSNDDCHCWQCAQSRVLLVGSLWIVRANSVLFFLVFR